MSKYFYTECGLDNVIIEGLTPVVDTDGDEVVEIPAVNLLHVKIAESIVARDGAMSGAELRFLRTEMGLSQVELAELVQRDKQTIGRWEREEKPIDGPAETVIKLIAIESLLEEFSTSVAELARNSGVEDDDHTINIRAKDGSYDLAAA